MDENINGYNKPKSATGLTVALVIAAVAIVLLVAALIVGTVYNVGRGVSFWGGTSNYSYSGGNSYTATSEFSVSAAEISSINISWIAGNVTVMVCDGEEIKVEEISNRTDPDDIMRYKVDRGTLEIKFRKSGRFISTNLKKDLIVEIPADIATALGIDIEAVSSDVDINTGGEVRDMDFESVGIATVSGHIHISDVNTDELDIETVSGDIIVCGNISKADIDTVSGDVAFDVYSNPSELKIDTVSGRVDIGLREEPRKVDVETVSGSITVGGTKTKREYESDNSAGVGEIDIVTVSGDVSVSTKK